jgi:hypothetical protein
MLACKSKLRYACLCSCVSPELQRMQLRPGRTEFESGDSHSYVTAAKTDRSWFKEVSVISLTALC